MTFTPEQVTLLLASGIALLAALSYLCARKTSYHRGKQEVYQEFADTFRCMIGTPMFGRDKAAKKAETTRRYMRLALVDPLVRDGLRDALAAADEFWTSPPP